MFRETLWTPSFLRKIRLCLKWPIECGAIFLLLASDSTSNKWWSKHCKKWPKLKCKPSMKEYSSLIKPRELTCAWQVRFTKLTTQMSECKTSLKRCSKTWKELCIQDLSVNSRRQWCCTQMYTRTIIRNSLMESMRSTTNEWIQNSKRNLISIIWTMIL